MTQIDKNLSKSQKNLACINQKHYRRKSMKTNRIETKEISRILEFLKHNLGGALLLSRTFLTPQSADSALYIDIEMVQNPISNSIWKARTLISRLKNTKLDKIRNYEITNQN